MPWWKQIIEFKPIDLALLASALGAVIWFFVSRFYQKRDGLRAIRLDTYKAFLNKMDEAHYSSRMNFGEIMNVSAETTAAILRSPNDSNDALIEMSNRLSQITKDSLKGWSVYSNEINQLTLVCSQAMLLHVEELKELNKKVFENYNAKLSSLNFLDPNTQVEFQKIINEIDQSRLTFLYNEIKRLMRKEIGN
jgi:hypothetical protein